ncbi:MAG: hypothetical protein P4L20_01405 [Acidimicrobiales bacterium]|jgi:hypothetical protein|nr:hypothetical protein [Acidimicrobiales bacterium]
MTKRKLVTATLFAGASLALTACGAASASHIVARVTTTTSLPSTSTTAPTVPGSVPASVPPAGTPTTTPSNGLSSQSLNQVAADLGSLDDNLNTANSDLNHPQGDS